MDGPVDRASLPPAVERLFQELLHRLAEDLQAHFAGRAEELPPACKLDLRVDQPPANPAVLSAIATLTERQLTYIRLACHPAEYTNEHMAELMGITRHAVDKLCRVVYAKFHVNSRQGLLLAVLRYGVGRV